MPKIVKELIEKDKIRGKMRLVFHEMKQKDILKQQIQYELLHAKTVEDLGVKFDERNQLEIEKLKTNKKMQSCLEKIKLRRRTPKRWLR